MARAIPALRPVLATLVDDPPTNDGWTFESKYDGVRLVAAIERHDARLLTRNGIDRAHQLPEIVAALRDVAARTGRAFVVDGALVSNAGEGTGRLQTLPRSFSRPPAGSASLSRARYFVLFDCLIDGDTVLVDETWRIRRRHLFWLVSEAKPLPSAIRLAESRDEGSAMLERARQGKREGSIARRVGVLYDDDDGALVHVGHEGRQLPGCASSRCRNHPAPLNRDSWAVISPPCAISYCSARAPSTPGTRASAHSARPVTPFVELDPDREPASRVWSR